MSSKAECSYVFKLHLEGYTPTPTEISVYARGMWLTKYCHVSNLLAEWAKYVDWRQHITEFMEWFVDLSYKQRDELAPRFTNEFAIDFRELWTGWLYEGGRLTYKSIPRDSPAFKEYSGGALCAVPDAINSEFPYLYDFDVTHNTWFATALWSAYKYIESGIDARAALNPSFIRSQHSVSSEAEHGYAEYIDSSWREEYFDNPCFRWNDSLTARWKYFPLEAIKWFVSLTEEQRLLYTRIWVSKSTIPDHKLVTYYDQGHMHHDLLLDTDPRVLKGSPF